MIVTPATVALSQISLSSMAASNLVVSRPLWIPSILLTSADPFCLPVHSPLLCLSDAYLSINGEVP